MTASSIAAMMIAIVLPIDQSNCSNAAWNAAIEITRVGPLGWPTRTADGKTLKLATKPSEKATAMPGARSGRVTRRNACQGPAPSVRAARSRSGSMPLA